MRAVLLLLMMFCGGGGGGGGGGLLFTARYGLRICEPRLVLCGKALLSHG